MSENNQVPIIFLAFANRDDSKDYLRDLPAEIHGITAALKSAEKEGLCKIIEKTYVTLDIIFEVFRENTNRIAVFHFGGHADSFNLMLQDSPAHKNGFIPFLASQKGLSLVFLNGCSTVEQTRELVAAGIPAAIGTNEDIDDEIATSLAIRFYKGLAVGLTLEKAWQDAVNKIKAGPDECSSRGFRRPNLTSKNVLSQYPWEVEYKKEVAEETRNWSLPREAQNYLFGLPPLPADIGYPKLPFLYLERFSRAHARIFFGRSLDIRDLYLKITKPESPPVILLYGQSGVGKSSLLEAGILPRLEGSYNVSYRRRDRLSGLLGALEEALNSFPRAKKPELHGEAQINDLWKQIEAQTGKPLIVLLDQVEEVFTDANKDLPNELDDFVAALKTIFNNPANYPKGKLILGYRKEYKAEVEDKLKEIKFTGYSDFFLKSLNRNGIMEAVAGITGKEKLRENYNLKVEDPLPGIIANNLLADNATPVAPTLQILLTKMWEMTKAEGSDVREFTIDRYQALWKNGLAMKDFLKMQMEELGRKQPYEVNSGLALDLLKFHTTEMGSARFREIEEIHRAYGNRGDVLEKLIEMEKNVYLLTYTDKYDPIKRITIKGASLAHDTLAPVVLNEYNESDRPGQRSSRILAAKIGDFEKNKNEVWLDEADLKIVEQGKDGMKSLSDNEIELLKISRKHKEQRERNKKRNIRIGASLIILVIIAAIVAGFLWRVSVKRADEANSRRLAVIAESVAKDDPPLALRIAEKAWQLDPNPAATETIYKIYRENIFYKIIARHEDTINSVAFSPDGQTILTGSWDNTARLWDLKGNLVKEFKGHTDTVSSVAFSPDGKTVLTGSDDNTARLWNLHGKTVQEFKGHEDDVTAVAFSPDGKTVLTGSWDNTARLWELNGNVQQEFKGHNDFVSSVSFSPDGKTILTGSWDNTARLWNLQGKTVQEFKEHSHIVSSVSFSPDGRTILTGSEDKTARLWDLQGKTIKEFKGHTEAVFSVAFSPDGKTFLTGSWDRTARLWDLQGNMLREFKGHAEKIYSISFSPDGKTFLTGSSDKTARLWDMYGNIVQKLKGHGDNVTSVNFSPDGKTILTGSWDGTARLWELARKNNKRSYRAYRSCLFSGIFPGWQNISHWGMG